MAIQQWGDWVHSGTGMSMGDYVDSVWKNTKTGQTLFPGTPPPGYEDAMRTATQQLQSQGHDTTTAGMLANAQLSGYTGLDLGQQSLTPSFTSLGTGINPVTGQRESIGGSGQWDPGTAQQRALLTALAIGGGAILSGAGAAGAGSAAAGGSAAPAAAMMPAAVPETAASLAGMGLTEVSPGVFAGAGAGGFLGAPAAGTPITSMFNPGFDPTTAAERVTPTSWGGATGSWAPEAASTAAGGAGGGLSTGALAGAGTAAGTQMMPSSGGGDAAAGAGLASALGGLSPAILGAGAGALLGGLGSSSLGTKGHTLEVEEGIPDWLQPYVRPVLDKYSTEVMNYNVDPYGIMPSAMQEFKNTIGGMYLDPSTNKYLEDYYKLGAERVKGSLQPSFGHMQAFGAHSGYNEALSRGLSDMATNLYGGAYERERGRQSQAMLAAPQYMGQNAAMSFTPYSQYLNTVGGMGRKKEEPYFTNPMQGILGGAMLGGVLGGTWT